MVKNIYRELTYTNEYQDSGEEYRTINNFNYVVSNIRLTQRRVKVKNNTSHLSRNFIKEIWAGEGIGYKDKKRSFEADDYFGPADETDLAARAAFSYNGIIEGNSEYSQKTSFRGLGGYVINIDVYNTSYEDVNTSIREIMNNNWLDDKTASLVLDFTVYNPYIDVLMYTRVTCGVDPSGRLVIKTRTDSMKRAYYSSWFDYILTILEFIFLIIYIVRKGYEIYQEYLEIQNQFLKDEKRK